MQLAATAALSYVAPHSETLRDPQIVVAGTFLALPNLVLLQCTRPRFPANAVCLALFTLGMAAVVAHATTHAPPRLAAEAMGLTAGIFLSLSATVLYGGHDYTFLEGCIFVGLLSLLGFSVLEVMFFSPWMHVLLQWVGIAVFSGYVLYDTSLLIHHLGPDDYIIAAVTLYLDIVNLFLYLLEMLRMLQGGDNN